MLKWLFPKNKSNPVEASASIPAAKPTRVETASVSSPSRTQGGTTSPSSIRQVTTQTFYTDVLESSLRVPVVVWFSAQWCGPCKMVAPGLAEVARENAGKLSVVQVDIDTDPEISQKFGIKSVPTFILFSKGEVVDIKVGAAPKTALAGLFAGWITKAAAYQPPVGKASAFSEGENKTHPLFDKFAVAVRSFGTISGDTPEDDEEELFYRVKMVTSFQFAMYSTLATSEAEETGNYLTLFKEVSLSEVVEGTFVKWEEGTLTHFVLFYLPEKWADDRWRTHPEFAHVQARYLTGGLDIKLELHDRERMIGGERHHLAIIVPRFPKGYRFPS